jgi:hypothetical protein
MRTGWCNECGQGGATNANGNECGCATNAIAGATNADGVQQMRTGCNECGATNANRVQRMWTTGATNAATNATATTGATDANGNECPKRGCAKLCLGARRVGDSNTKWRQGEC